VQLKAVAEGRQGQMYLEKPLEGFLYGMRGVAGAVELGMKETKFQELGTTLLEAGQAGQAGQAEPEGGRRLADNILAEVLPSVDEG
jgi:hypothetical protein